MPLLLEKGLLAISAATRASTGHLCGMIKISYQWCLESKQMGKRCTAPTRSRDWTKEDMMAYLGWSKAKVDLAPSDTTGQKSRAPSHT